MEEEEQIVSCTHRNKHASQRISPEIEAPSVFTKSSIRRSLALERVLRVLVVDDSPLNIKILVRHIHLANAVLHSDENNSETAVEIIERSDGRDAVTCVEESMRAGIAFDVVFMDNIMMHMHGPEAARRLRAMGYSGLIIGVTGNVLPKDVQEYLDAGADQIVPKPITTSAIKDILLTFGG